MDTSRVIGVGFLSVDTNSDDDTNTDYESKVDQGGDDTNSDSESVPGADGANSDSEDDQGANGAHGANSDSEDDQGANGAHGANSDSESVPEDDDANSDSEDDQEGANGADGANSDSEIVPGANGAIVYGVDWSDSGSDSGQLDQADPAQAAAGTVNSRADDLSRISALWFEYDRGGPVVVTTATTATTATDENDHDQVHDILASCARVRYELVPNGAAEPCTAADPGAPCTTEPGALCATEPGPPCTAEPTCERLVYRQTDTDSWDTVFAGTLEQRRFLLSVVVPDRVRVWLDNIIYVIPTQAFENFPKTD